MSPTAALPEKTAEESRPREKQCCWPSGIHRFERGRCTRCGEVDPQPVPASLIALREEAARREKAAQDSYERCDTDGALSQMAHRLNAQEARLQADIEEAGGVAPHAALFDLDGNLVPAKLMHGDWGPYFAHLDERGRITGKWFTPSKSRDGHRARAADEAKGYYVGYVLAPSKAELRGGNITCLTAVAVRTDGGYSADVEIADNGQDTDGPALGRWYSAR